MSRNKDDAAADRRSAQAESAAGQTTADCQSVGRWLPAPRKRPIILGVLAALYLVWLLALAGMAVRALQGG